jgi:hypothetical protein
MTGDPAYLVTLGVSGDLLTIGGVPDGSAKRIGDALDALFGTFEEHSVTFDEMAAHIRPLLSPTDDVRFRNETHDERFVFARMEMKPDTWRP